MNSQEVNALLTAASEMDNFIKNADAEFAVWERALAGVDSALASEVLTRFYADREPGGSSITPGHIRRSVAREVERAAVKRAALERGPDVNYQRQVNTWRSRNPDEWDALVKDGAHDQWSRWNRAGEADRACRCGCGSAPTASPVRL